MALVEFVSNEQIDAAEAQKSELYTANEKENPLEIGLVGYLNKCWEANKRAKGPIQARLIKCKMQRKGQYDATKHAEIKRQGGSEIFMMLTDIKCAAGESWVGDILSQSGEKPWALDITPEPDIPNEVVGEIEERVMLEAEQLYGMTGEVPTADEVRQRSEDVRDEVKRLVREHAKECAQRQERAINDDFVEGGWYQALLDIRYDLFTYPTAFFEGPVIRKKECLEWEKTPFGFEPIVTEEIKEEYQRHSPFNVYPAEGAITLNDGPLFIVETLTRGQLHDCIGVDGYSEEQIRAVLTDFGTQGYTIDRTQHVDAVDPKRDNEHGETGSKNDNPEGIIEALKFWAPIKGEYLEEWGMEVDDPQDEYEVTGHMIGRHLIRLVFNEHPLKKRPVYSACYRRNPDSVWGEMALPEVMSDVQDICNAAARNLVNNMAIASGPQVEVNIDRVPPGEDITQLWPWKIHQTTDEKAGGSSPAINFYQPSPMTDALMRVYEYFFKQASEVTGIPAYIYGSPDVGGAARTATGLSMLMNTASKGLKMVVSNVDEGIIIPSISNHHIHLLLYYPDKVYMGDVRVRPRASEYLVMLEQLQVRWIEFLNATANEFDNEIIGHEGRAKLLRRVAEGMKLDDVIPDDRQVKVDEVQQEIIKVLEAISASFNVPVEVLVQAIQNPGKQPAGPKEVTPAGEQTGGRDMALFNQG